MFSKAAYRVVEQHLDKTARKQKMYHGTHSGVLRKILKEGLVPTPKQKQWQDIDPEFGKYWGVYFTDRIDSAAYHANRAAKKYGTNPVFVIAQIQTRSPEASLDEEYLVTVLHDILKWSNPSTYDEFLQEFKKGLLELFEEEKALTIDQMNKMWRNMELIEKTAELYYAWRHEGEDTLDEFKRVLKRLMKSLQFLLAHPINDQALVLHKPVAYKGAINCSLISPQK